MEMIITPLQLQGIDESKRPIVISGPCSAETEEQVINTAQQLAEKGIKIFRAGVWKPRTKPGGFEGMGEEALPWMKRVKEETGMLTATEVATPKHVELALNSGIDILWIGARTSANPFAIQELADALKGIDEMDQKLFKGVSEEELESLVNIFDKLIINLAEIEKNETRLTKEELCEIVDKIKEKEENQND